MRWISLPLLLALVGCPKSSTDPVVTPEDSGPADTEPLPVDPEVRMGVLDNGMHWYVEHNTEPENRVVFRMAVDAGSILEDDDQRGLAHLLEHMAFNGSTHFDGNELIEYLESVGTRFGAHLNAHTSVDETVYKLQVPTDDPELLDKAFLVFDDWASGITNSDEAIEGERGVVLEEWRSRRSANARIRDAMRPLNYYGSKYVDRKTIGTEESLKTFEPAAVRRFYEDWYRPDLMAIIVVGDIDLDYAQAKIEEHFGDIEMPENPRERIRPEVPAHDEMFVSILTDPEITRTGVGITHKHDDAEQATYGSYRTMLVDRLISRMVNERFSDMAQEPDAPFLGASTSSGKLTPIEGQTAVGAATPEGEVLGGLEAIAIEIQRVRQHGFTNGELGRARDAELRGYQDYYDERDTTHSRTHADELVRVFLTGESMPGITKEWELAQEYLGSVTVDDVNTRAASHWMNEDSRVLSIIMPDKEGLTPPTEEEVRALLAKVDEMEISPPEDDAFEGPLMAELPEPGSVTERREVPELDATVWTLSNGVTVWLKATDFKSDQVLMRSYSEGGIAKVDDASWVAATTATSLRAASGLGEWDAAQIKKFLAGKQASASSWIGSHHEGVSGSASPMDLETMFELTHLAITQPRFDEDAFAVNKRGRIEGLRNRDSNPNTLYSDTFQRLMWGDHPRRQPWTLETIEAMDLTRSQEIYSDRFADTSDFTFVLVGNIDEQTLEPLVTQYLATLPVGEREDAPGDDGARRQAGVHEETVRAGLEPKARFRLEMHGPFEGSWLERGQLSALREVLSVRLRKELREELGGVYGVGVSTGTWSLPEPGYRFTITWSCDPDRVDELQAAALAVVTEVLENGVEESEVEDVKEKNRRSREEDLLTNGFWANGILGALRRGEDPRDLLTYDERNDSLDAEVVHQAAKTWIDLDQHVTVVLLPEAAPEDAE